jgi:SAM-dependent methyltransferase
MGVPAKIRVAEHIEVLWPAGQFGEAVCPVCGFTGAVAKLLEIDYRPPDAEHFFTLQICPACTARFVDNPETMDYATDLLIEIGWHVYQIQLGAGVWPIAAPLTRVDKPAGARILEIGGAYGFGLDFGIRARGWTGEGFDPSPLAAFGAGELGLLVVQDYFEAKDLHRGPYDVIVATEVIEHIAAPPEFLALMRRAIAADGVLVMTTPDAARIAPDLPSGQLMPLLSPGAHLVLQTAESLQHALIAAGFSHVRIVRDGMSLVAYASAAPFGLSADMAAGRAMYRDYLLARSRLTAPESDLLLGFAGRGLFEAASEGDLAAADVAWETLLPAVQGRFGMDLATLERLPAAASRASLAELGRLMPLGLGMILFGRAMRLLAGGADRRPMIRLLDLAVEAIDALQGALGRRSLTDGLSASIREVALTERALCRADAGEAGAVAELVAIARREPAAQAGWRGFVGLVNAGALAAARELQSALELWTPGADVPPGLKRDALRCLANFDLAPGGAPLRALDHADGLAGLGEDESEIVLLAFTRLVNDSRDAAALQVRRRYDMDALMAGPGVAGADARLAGLILELRAGDPAAVPARLAAMELPAVQRQALLLAAFTGLVNAGRYDDARAVDTAHGLTAGLEGATGAAAASARIAAVFLDFAGGRTAAAVDRVLAMLAAGTEDAVLDALLVDGFVRLINEGMLAAARRLNETQPVMPRLQRCGPALRQDGLAALLLLELQPGGDAQRIMALTVGDGGSNPAILELPAARREALLLAAYTALVNAGRYDEARAIDAARGLTAGLDDATGAAAAARVAAVILDFSCGRTAAAVDRVLAMKEGGAEDAVLDGLLVDGFVRLVNEGMFEAARRLDNTHPVMPRLEARSPALRQDGLAALLLLELQPHGDAQRIMELVEEAERAGLAEARWQDLAMAGFVNLVNRSDFERARGLAAQLDPALRKLRPPYERGARNALFAAGVLGLQDKDGLRPAAATFGRLRDALAKDMPDGVRDELFWPALRGEIVALHRLERVAEANALLAEYIPLVPGAPDDLLVLLPPSEGASTGVAS